MTNPSEYIQYQNIIIMTKYHTIDTVCELTQNNPKLQRNKVNVSRTKKSHTNYRMYVGVCVNCYLCIYVFFLNERLLQK